MSYIMMSHFNNGGSGFLGKNCRFLFVSKFI